MKRLMLTSGFAVAKIENKDINEEEFDQVLEFDNNKSLEDNILSTFDQSIYRADK